MTHDSEENPSAEADRTTIHARKPGKSDGTPRTGVQVSQSGRQIETAENVGNHLHLGTREGAGLD